MSLQRNGYFKLARGCDIRGSTAAGASIGGAFAAPGLGNCTAACDTTQECGLPARASREQLGEAREQLGDVIDSLKAYQTALIKQTAPEYSAAGLIDTQVATVLWASNALSVASVGIMMLDVGAKNLREFKKFLQRYEGATGRFLDPDIAASAPVRLSHRSRDDVLSLSSFHVVPRRSNNPGRPEFERSLPLSGR